MLNSTRVRPIHAVIALAGVLAVLLSACTSDTKGSGQTAASTSGSGSGTAQSSDSTSPAPSSSKPTAPPTKPVHFRMKFSDGSTFGVGIPVIATFNKKITSGVAFQKATTATVNGKPAQGAWFFEYSDPSNGYVMEAHYRLQQYWPAHSQIHVNVAAKGQSAGKGLTFDDSLSLDFATGAANVSTVDESTHKLTVTTDGRPWGTFRVSLGSNATPTKSGIKVIMEKGLDISMRGPGYFDAHVKFTQRLTYGGEYLHAAPWNCVGSPGCVGPQNNIGHADSSNGCTNLTPADAKKLYGFLSVGDVVRYPNATGGQMQLGQGYGDWNVQWGQWQTGGVVPTR